MKYGLMRRDWTKVIAVVQIIGGIMGVAFTVFGLVFTLVAAHAEGQLPSPLYFSYSIPFVLACVAGILLWKGKKAGVLLSLILQAAQIPAFNIKYFAYSFYVGPYIPLEFTQFRLSLSFSFGASLSYYAPENEPFLLAVNLAALGAFLFLIKKFRRDASNAHN